jgi:hypothetical protein
MALQWLQGRPSRRNGAELRPPGGLGCKAHCEPSASFALEGRSTAVCSQFAPPESSILKLRREE